MKRWVFLGGAGVALVVFGVFFAGEASKSLGSAALPDFPNYYLGGERLFDGRPVYGPLEAEVQERFGVEGYDAYPADPPPTVLLVAPLSLLTYDAAWLVLAGVSVVVLLTVTYMTSREVGLSAEVGVLLAGIALLTTSSRFLLIRNHVEGLVLLLGFFGWRALRRNRSGAAGVWWGLATGLKLFPGMWLVGLARKRTQSGVLAGAGTLMGVGLLSGVVLGWSNVADFITQVVGSSTRWYGALGNYSLLSLGTALSSVTLGWVLTAVGAAVVVPLYLRYAIGPDQVWVAGTAAALLLSPLSWLNYLVLAIPALIIVGTRLDLKARTDRWLLLGLVASLGFWGPVVFSSELPSLLVSFVPTYGLVALFVVALRRLGEPTEVGSVSV